VSAVSSPGAAADRLQSPTRRRQRQRCTALSQSLQEELALSGGKAGCERVGAFTHQSLFDNLTETQSCLMETQSRLSVVKSDAKHMYQKLRDEGIDPLR
jgi:hypothetical protein